MSARRLRIVLSIVEPTLSACDGDLVQAPSHGELPTVQVAASATPMQSASDMVEPHFDAMADAIDGFAGMYYERGELIVRVAGSADHSNVVPAIEGYQGGVYLSRADGGPGRRDVRIEPADFTFRQLHEWRQRALAAFNLPGVRSLDLDERLNRVEIGVSSLDISGSVEEVVAKLGVPSEAVVITVKPAITSIQTVQDRVRPIRGGLKIENDVSTPCSLGFNALSDQIIDTGEGFVTASHCTEQLARRNDGIFYQKADNGTDRVGSEALDPNPFTGGSCPAGKECRRSDAAFVLYDDSVTWTLGKLIRTTNWSRTQGGLTITSPDLNIGGDARSTPPLLDQELHKVGQKTGTTFGPVDETCVDKPHPDDSNLLILCSYSVWAGVKDGDSGAAVFEVQSGSDVILHGIVWAREVESLGGEGDESFWFSPYSQVYADLGPLVVR